ncbi:peptidylprolyl isomerase [Puteibacter caeruleilacunae]|nr:peptidylprolyl isomerase [Puteibacter caeruleilacunae]
MKALHLILIALLTTVLSCKQGNNQVVTIDTKYGLIEVEVYSNKAPVTAKNFLQLVEKNSYNPGYFYRVVTPSNQPNNDVKIEVIQGGLFNDSIVAKYPTIIHETTDKTKIKHLDGVISMARNEPGSASTEFFICVGDQPALDFGGKRNPDGQGFAAFGKVVKGMDVVRKIHQLKESGQYLEEMVEFKINGGKGER